MKSSAASKKDAAPVEIFLRVKHPTMDPAEITQALRIEPEHSVHAGPAQSRSGVQRVHSESYWLARLPVRSLGERALATMSSAEPKQLPAFARDRVARLAATQYDWYVLEALEPLQDKKEFLQRLNHEGSIMLLLQRLDHTTPLSLRIALPRLTELGIAIEID